MRTDLGRCFRFGAFIALVAVLGPVTSGGARAGGRDRVPSLPAAGMRARVGALSARIDRAERAADARRAQIRRVRRRRGRLAILLAARADRAAAPLPPAIRDAGSAARRRRQSGFELASLRRRRSRIPARIAWRRRSLRRLGARASRLERRLRVLQPIGVCPVPRATTISDDFGAPRYDHGVYHAHQGNDISAAFGSPIVAPFDGRAVAVANELGGLAVDVFGPAGHVYNAHLSGLGRLGVVTAGTVIGYVGESGNATSPHDHFEWHPNNGPAVDPHVVLMLACGAPSAPGVTPSRGAR